MGIVGDCEDDERGQDGGGVRKGKGKRTPKRQRIGHEWDQTDEYTSVPIPSMSCGEKQPETESPGPKITSEEWEVPLERVKSTCTETRPDQAIDSSCATTS